MDSENPQKAALNRAADCLGGQAALAAALGFSDRRSVWPWFNTDRRVPAEHCPAIEHATGGRVAAEELCEGVVWQRVPDKAWPHPKGRPCIDFAADIPVAKTPKPKLAAA